MKIIYKIIKKLCLGLFGIYSINLLFQALNIIIPINIFTICVSSFLGIFGLFALIIIQLMI